MKGPFKKIKEIFTRHSQGDIFVQGSNPIAEAEAIKEYQEFLKNPNNKPTNDFIKNSEQIKLEEDFYATNFRISGPDGVLYTSESEIDLHYLGMVKIGKENCFVDLTVTETFLGDRDGKGDTPATYHFRGAVVYPSGKVRLIDRTEDMSFSDLSEEWPCCEEAAMRLPVIRDIVMYAEGMKRKASESKEAANNGQPAAE